MSDDKCTFDGETQTGLWPFGGEREQLVVHGTIVSVSEFAAFAMERIAELEAALAAERRSCSMCGTGRDRTPSLASGAVCALNEIAHELGMVAGERIDVVPAVALDALRGQRKRIAELEARIVALQDCVRSEVKRREDAERCRNCYGKSLRDISFVEEDEHGVCRTRVQRHYCTRCKGTGRDRGPGEGDNG